MIQIQDMDYTFRSIAGKYRLIVTYYFGRNERTNQRC